MSSITEAMKTGPSISEVARNLGVSRAALYRLMEQYDKGDTADMNRDVLDYFTKISSNEFQTKEQAVQYLGQLKDLREAKNESDGDRYAELRQRIFALNRELMETASTMSQEEYVKKAETLKKLRTELTGLDEGYRMRFRRSRYDEHAESKWFQDDGIRSAVISGNDCAMIVLGAEYDMCQSAVIDLYVQIEGEMIPIARRRPEPDERFVMVDFLQIGLTYGYRITWTSENMVKTTDTHEFRTW